MYDIVINDADRINLINKFIKELGETIVNINEVLREDFIKYKVDNLIKNIGLTNDTNNLLNYLFEIKKLGLTHSFSKIEKIKYNKNDCDTILIVQYYETEDEQRQKENTISLINNILNPCITKIHLLNEKLYDLEHIFKSLDNANKGNNFRHKVKQHIIEKRMTFHDSMAFANKFCKNSIIIVANLDIFFNEDLHKLQSYDFSNLFLSMSRYEMLNDYEFGGNNQVAKFIHNGQLGNPCIDSHDAWIFKTPIKMTNDSKIMLGSLGCDTIINYVYGETMKYNVINPIDSIMTIHYHRERERDYRTENSVRSHSGIVYNKDNKFKSDDYNHKYVLQKSVLVCNTIESFCTFATKNAFDDLRLLLHSLEIYHKDIPIFIYCDDYIAEKIDNYNFDLQIHKKIELNKYTKLNRQSMTEQNIFIEFLLNKANVIDYAMETYSNTLFIDADIVILNKMDLLIDKSCDVGLSPHNIFESSQKMFGVYNAGFMYVANKKITNYWKHIINIKNGYDDQQALDYFEEEFKVFKFDDSYNFGWWRLFQCEIPQERANLFTTQDNNLYYSYKTLKCIHTHLYDTNDPQTTQFNKFILQLLEKINHPMLKFIQNKNTKNTKINNNSNNNNSNNNKSNNKKIVAFTQTYGNERYVEILLQKYDKVGQYIRNKCDKIIYSFHNCSVEIIEKCKTYLNDIYSNDKLEFLIYDDMNYLTSIRKTMSYLKSIDTTDILFMNDDEYFLNNSYNVNNLQNIDMLFNYYVENNIKWLSLYGLENVPKNKKEKKCITLSNDLNIYCFSTLEYKKDNLYAWSQTTALYSLDFCIDLYNNKLPDDSWNIEETFSYYFHTNDHDRYGCNIDLVRAINLHGHNLSSLSLYDNLHRFFFEETDSIYSIINNLNSTLINSETRVNILSLGSSCDGANILKHFNYQKENKFFDFLWNELDGLDTVCEIINTDFKYFDNIENFTHKKNKIVAWEGTEINNKIINKYYSNLLFFHIKEELNNTHIESFKRKIIRTQEILNSVNHKYFIYYRHYEYCNDLNILINETNKFSNIYINKFNTNFTLLSCIMVHNNINKNTLNTLMNTLEKNNTNNIKYSYVYKTDDYNIETTRLSRESWKNVLDKYIIHTNNEHSTNKINTYEVDTNEDTNEDTKKDTKVDIIEKNIDNCKPTIIIPKMPRTDFWNHSNDTFRELLMLWNENNLINLVEDNVKHVWYNKIGDILLYDRPTLDWLEQDTNVIYDKILFGNPLIPDNLKNKAVNWIFWGRSPRKLNYFANMESNSYNERRIESIFIGKIENNIQAKYRLQYKNIENVIQLYIMHKSDEPYRYNQEEYLNLLRNSKFGLCLRGFGPKCNREIELMGLGTVPIVACDVDMCNYYDSLIENVHYFRFNTVDNIKEIISSCTIEKWNTMSRDCIKWYNKNCSLQGSFETTKYIIENFDKVVELSQSKQALEILDNTIETYNNVENLKSVDDITDKIIFDFGKEEEFIRENLKSYFNISKIYELHKKNHNDVLWDDVNKFIRVQNKYIAKFENVKINSEGVMYDNMNVYTLNNNYYKKNSIIKKELYKFDDNIVVFNCVQKWAYGYYHWLCEVYPRLFYIKLYIENNSHLFTDKKIVLLLYYNDNFIKQFLEILNFKNICICPYNSNLEYHANITYLYTPAFCGNPSKDAINIIRKSLFNNSVCVPKINILIKRNNNRIIHNFEAVYNLLKTNYNNYEWIVFDSEDEICKNSIKTIQLFSQVNLIIGAHGAGLTNMIFASSNAKIIELHPDNCGNVCYWHLSRIINNTHIMLLVKSISQLEFIVNLEQLDITVNNLLNDLFCLDNI